MGVIDDYLEDLGDSQRAELERIRRIVLDRVPGAEEGRSYGMPAFRYRRKPLLGFAALKDHLSLFPFSPHVVVESRSAPQRCPALRSGGQQLAHPIKVSEVMCLQDDLTGVEVGLHLAGELNGLVAREVGDDRTVRFDLDQVDAYVPEPYPVVARGGHPFGVENGQVPRADRSMGERQDLL
jgi:hypothetical protein